MPDTISKERRSWNMIRIKGKDTSPEVSVRSCLFRKGLRFRKHVTNLPGRPDIVLPKYRTVIFINGCLVQDFVYKRFMTSNFFQSIVN